MKLLFTAFLLTAAIQDLRCQQVKIWVFVLFGILALALDGALWLTNGLEFLWIDHLKSCCLGLCVLMLSKIFEGGIGLGDGLFFLISGLMLDFEANLFVMCMGVMICGIYGLALYVWNFIFQKRDIRKRTIPFLPFAVVPGVWTIVMGIYGHGG